MSLVLQKVNKEAEKEVEESQDNIDPKLPPMISDADYQKISNSSYNSFKEGLDALEKNPSVQLVDHLHMVLLANDAQNSSNVLSLIPRFLAFLRHGDLYDAIVLVLCDIPHLNPKSSRILIDSQIFDLLDYKKNVSWSLVFSICDENEEAWSILKSKHDIDQFENENIDRLKAQHK